MLSSKVSVILFRFELEIEGSDRLFVKISSMKFEENESSRSRDFPRGQTKKRRERRDEDHHRFFKNVLKMRQIYFY
jgi:hypothetical protein